jgi:hypothetical protein
MGGGIVRNSHRTFQLLKIRVDQEEVCFRAGYTIMCDLKPFLLRNASTQAKHIKAPSLFSLSRLFFFLY